MIINRDKNRPFLDERYVYVTKKWDKLIPYSKCHGTNKRPDKYKTTRKGK